jgi:hypothetical protein
MFPAAHTRQRRPDGYGSQGGGPAPAWVPAGAVAEAAEQTADLNISSGALERGRAQSPCSVSEHRRQPCYLPTLRNNRSFSPCYSANSDPQHRVCGVATRRRMKENLSGSPCSSPPPMRETRRSAATPSSSFLLWTAQDPCARAARLLPRAVNDRIRSLCRVRGSFLVVVCHLSTLSIV